MAEKLRIVFFGSASGFSMASLAGLTEEVTIAGLVLAQPANRVRRFWRKVAGKGPAADIERLARERRIPLLHYDPAAVPSLARQLRLLAPDLICISIFPHLLPEELVSVARLGAINTHPSLLPRHRGPLPIFWTYHSGDEAAGVTLHYASDRFDAGDIILRTVLPLKRAYPATQLDRDLAVAAAQLLRRGVGMIAAGTATREPQDERAATLAPLVRMGQPMVDFDSWDVLQVHHFMAGLFPRFREPLRDPAGRPVQYESILGFERIPHDVSPGTILPRKDVWALHCKGGLLYLK